METVQAGVHRLVKALKRQDVDVVHLILYADGNYPECLHEASIKKPIEDAGVRVVEGTDH